MNYFEELMRISETIEDDKDSEILKAAAVKLMSGPEPKYEKVTEIPGYGYQYSKVY